MYNIYCIQYAAKDRTGGTVEQIILKARAKINLGLDVCGKRDDGYHEVSMVMQTIGIYDKLVIRKVSRFGITIESNAGFLPTNENNLIYKAAKLLMDEFGIREGIYVYLNKFIPVAAGLAGGSSDAAATLIGVNRIFGLGLSTDELMVRAKNIGADVPYCIMRGTALAEGIGEKLTRLKPMPKCPVIIAKPAVNVSTRLVYERLDSLKTVAHPDIKGMCEAIENSDLHKIASLMGNVLERVTIPMVPQIEKIKGFMIEKGALNAMMSGSGPTVFGLFDSADTAKECYTALKESGLARNVYITEIFTVV